MGKIFKIAVVLILINVTLVATSYLPQNIEKTVEFYAEIPENAYVVALNINDSHDYGSLMTSYNQGDMLVQNATTTIDFNGYTYYLSGTKTKVQTMNNNSNMYKVGQVILFSNIINKALDVSISVSKNNDNVIDNDIMFSDYISNKSSYITENTINSMTSFTSTITASNKSYYIVKDIFAKLGYKKTTESIDNTTIKIDLTYN